MSKVLLSDICKPKQWKTIPSSDLLNNGYPVYGANGIIGYYSTYNHEHPTILVTCRGATCGTVNISVPFSYCTGNAMALDELSEDCDIKYVFYALKYRGFHDVISGSAQPQIIRANIEKVDISMRELNEQRRIAKTLDAAAELLRLRKQQLAELDALVKSRFIEMFGDPEINPMGWERAKIGSVLSVEPQNGFYRPQSDYRTDESGLPILRIDSFYDGRVTSWASLKRLIATDEEKKRYLLRNGDIVLNRVNSIEYLGKCALIKDMLEDTVFESNLMRFHPNEMKVLSPYLVHFLCLPYTYNQVIKHAKKSVNQASINQTDVKDFNILIPPLALQTQFADFVQKVEAFKALVQKSIDETQALFDSLMSEYFE